MNSLSCDDICSQLFYLSKEAIKTLALNSKCGIQTSLRSSKKSSPTNDISILNNFSPLLCIYRKASPVLIHSKTSNSLDESSFKKDLSPSANALMTLCLLELSEYYSNYANMNRADISLEKPYLFLCKNQLKFYSENLRNSEGLFITKKNLESSDLKGFSLIESDKKICYCDQAFMMNAYYLYYLYNQDDPTRDDYKNFSLEILDMFCTYKESLYDRSFDECSKLLLAFTMFYDYSKDEKCKSLLIDLSDFLISKFDEKDYYSSSLDSCALFALGLKDSYKHTDILPFKEHSDKIFEKLTELYDEKKGLFIKPSDKKDIKYSSMEICFYFLAMLVNYRDNNSSIDGMNMLSNLYKKLFINSGLIASWPVAPTLDEVERYKGLSLHSCDMLEESFFRLSSLPSPESIGIAPIINKSITYSRKKDYFYHSNDSFDSEKNMLIFFAFTYYLKDIVVDIMNFTKSDEARTTESISNPVSTDESRAPEDALAPEDYSQ